MAEQDLYPSLIVKVQRTGNSSNEHVEVDYSIPYEDGMTYMDTLRYIADKLDDSFAFYEHSCKRGFCGACLILVNDKKVLSCRTRVNKQESIEIKPAMAVIKDYYPKL